MIETQTIEAIATEAASWFETATRPDGETFDRRKDGAPEWIADLVYDAHGDMSPDDWRYGCIRAAVEAIAEGYDPDDGANEFADSYVDVYDSALTDWLSSHGTRPDYVDQAGEEFGDDPRDGIMEKIRGGQYLEALEVFASVARFLENRTEEVSV